MFLLGLFFILVALLFVRFSVEILLVTDGLEFTPGIKLGIGRFLVAIPQGFLVKASHRIRERNFVTTEATLRGVKVAARSLDNLLQRIELFHLEVRIGTGDAFWTSLGAGGLWAIVGSLLAGLGSGNRLKAEPEIRIQPDYDQTSIRVHLHCIFQFRVGQIIINELKRVMV
ncbi:MAG TPA: DUF2953 domain-containing protein [Limnochordia bacterium]|nr:DUF2953 domain-containing protein [Limnochordia bacterium]